MRYVESASYIRFKSKNDITIIFILSCMHFIVSRVEFSSNYLGINTLWLFFVKESITSAIEDDNTDELDALLNDPHANLNVPNSVSYISH